jgi:xanthine dehydrogenase accessory factor
MKPIIEAMQAQARQGIPFALATVISRNGSAPRSAGAKMLVKAGGAMVGTVGGGALEAQVQRLAVKMIEQRSAVIQAFEFSGRDAASMDAICGGQVEVLVEFVDPTDAHSAAVIQGLQAAIAQHRKAWLITTLPAASSALPAWATSLLQPDGSLVGVLPAGLTAEWVREVRQPLLVEREQGQVMIEPLDIAGTAYIFGAGHVSRSLAKFTHAVGFWTVVLDDRLEYANPERFPAVDGLVVLESFEHALEGLQIDRDSFVVIVTRGHLNDLTVLAQVLRTQAGYIGMIGSRRKCALIFQELRRMGYPEEDIRRVHAPIGLPIEAETPEEIGVSIVAEMIQARAKSFT